MPYKVLLNNDERANFTCGSKGLKRDLEKQSQEYTPLSKLDYGVSVLRCSKPEPEIEPEIDTRVNLSYMNVKNVEEGIDWYRNLDSKIPEELLSLMSRWSFGDLPTLTKKQMKNQRKKKRTKTMKTDIKFESGPQIVVFD